ncbi:SLOG domain-containing protein [Lysobacter humi (ex Lee et al. 2017)]
MREIFLSASVPTDRNRAFQKSANPFLIQFAVRELVATCLGRVRIVWGGHPSITPMVHAVCSDFGMEFDAPVVLYQSEFFTQRFPIENRFFQTELVAAVEGDERKSLTAMRHAMLVRPDIDCAVFIGGMEGIVFEHELLAMSNPRARQFFLCAPGGAAAAIAADHPEWALEGLDFGRQFHRALDIDPTAPRDVIPRSPRPFK